MKKLLFSLVLTSFSSFADYSAIPGAPLKEFHEAYASSIYVGGINKTFLKELEAQIEYTHTYEALFNVRSQGQQNELNKVLDKLEKIAQQSADSNPLFSKAYQEFVSLQRENPNTGGESGVWDLENDQNRIKKANREIRELLIAIKIIFETWEERIKKAIDLKDDELVGALYSGRRKQIYDQLTGVFWKIQYSMEPMVKRYSRLTEAGVSVPSTAFSIKRNCFKKAVTIEDDYLQYFPKIYLDNSNYLSMTEDLDTVKKMFEGESVTIHCAKNISSTFYNANRREIFIATTRGFSRDYFGFSSRFWILDTRYPLNEIREAFKDLDANLE